MKYSITCQSLDSAIDHCVDVLGYSLISIYPADNPEVAHLLKGTVTLRLITEPDAPAFPSAFSKEHLDSFPDSLPLTIPSARLDSIALNSSETESSVGRAGMVYRDLFQHRFNGFLVASHITIPGGGAVADYVHSHNLLFQTLYCMKGSALLVYEDQGQPFHFKQGELILQPPGIRHQVLESNDDLEVLEISCPAMHETNVEQALRLPTNVVNKERLYNGQKFFHLLADEHGHYSTFKDSSNGIATARRVKISANTEYEFEPRGLMIGLVLEGAAKWLCADMTKNLETNACFSVAKESARIVAEKSTALFLIDIDLERVEALYQQRLG